MSGPGDSNPKKRRSLVAGRTVRTTMVVESRPKPEGPSPLEPAPTPPPVAPEEQATVLDWPDRPAHADPRAVEEQPTQIDDRAVALAQLDDDAPEKEAEAAPAVAVIEEAARPVIVQVAGVDDLAPVEPIGVHQPQDTIVPTKAQSSLTGLLERAAEAKRRRFASIAEQVTQPPQPPPLDDRSEPDAAPIESAPAAPAAPPVPPVAAEPVIAEPVVAEPVVAEPVVAEPVAAEPVAAEPVAAEPVATAPEPVPAAEPPFGHRDDADDSPTDVGEHVHRGDDLPEAREVTVDPPLFRDDYQTPNPAERVDVPQMLAEARARKRSTTPPPQRRRAAPGPVLVDDEPRVSPITVGAILVGLAVFLIIVVGLAYAGVRSYLETVPEDLPAIPTAVEPAPSSPPVPVAPSPVEPDPAPSAPDLAAAVTEAPAPVSATPAPRAAPRPRPAAPPPAPVVVPAPEPAPVVAPPPAPAPVADPPPVEEDPEPKRRRRDK